MFNKDENPAQGGVFAVIEITWLDTNDIKNHSERYLR